MVAVLPGPQVAKSGPLYGRILPIPVRLRPQWEAYGVQRIKPRRVATLRPDPFSSRN